MLILPSASYAHGFDTLLRRLLSEEFSAEYISNIFNHPDFNRTESPTTPACDNIRAELMENPETFRKKTLERGVTYYETHKGIFDAVERESGMAPEYILAILRKETYFGICNGDQYIFRGLYNLYTGTSEPKWRSFAITQIQALLSIAKEERWGTEKLLSTPGSWAGAFGICHFIPSSFQYAVDGNRDSVKDLFDPRDAIPSIAHYFLRRGWDVRSRDKDTIREMILDYNPSGSYADSVIAFADAIRPKIKPPRQ